MPGSRTRWTDDRAPPGPRRVTLRGVLRSRVPLRYAVVVLIAGLFLVNVVRALVADHRRDAAAPARGAVRTARGILVDVDQLEVCYHARHARFSDRLAELDPVSRDAAEDPIQGSGIVSALSDKGYAIDLVDEPRRPDLHPADHRPRGRQLHRA